MNPTTIDFGNIKIVGLNSDLTIKNLAIEQSINNHSVLTVLCMMPEETDESYVYKFTSSSLISALQIENEGQNKVLFSGRPTQVEMISDGGVRYMKLHCTSSSQLLDIEKKSRSFQNVHMTYGELISTVLNDYKDADFVYDDSRDEEEIGRLIIQFEETDWDFLKRVVSFQNKGLIPESTSGKLRFYVGLPKRSQEKKIDYNMHGIYRRTHQTNQNIINKWLGTNDENDCIYYEIKNILDFFSIGEKLVYQGRNFRVGASSSVISEAEGLFKHTYRLSTETGWLQPKIFCDQLQGVSLEGRVIDRAHGYAKMHLLIDAKQDVETAMWFRFPSMYTAGDRKGWTAMPELKDHLFLHFPTEEEDKCYVICSLSSSAMIDNAQKAINANDVETPSSRLVQSEEPVSEPQKKDTTKNDERSKAMSNAVKGMLDKAYAKPKRIKVDLQRFAQRSSKRIKSRAGIQQPETKYVLAPQGQSLTMNDDYVYLSTAGGTVTVEIKPEGVYVVALGDINLTSYAANIETQNQFYLGGFESVNFKSGLSTLKLDIKGKTVFDSPKISVLLPK